jgi:hypothetical protein
MSRRSTKQPKTVKLGKLSPPVTRIRSALTHAWALIFLVFGSRFKPKKKAYGTPYQLNKIRAAIACGKQLDSQGVYGAIALMALPIINACHCCLGVNNGMNPAAPTLKPSHTANRLNGKWKMKILLMPKMIQMKGIHFF